MSENIGESPAERRVRLERRLADVQAELAELAQERLGHVIGDSMPLRERSEELESEADVLRHELGVPEALGRPPRPDGIGWVLVCGGAVVFVLLIWLFLR